MAQFSRRRLINRAIQSFLTTASFLTLPKISVSNASADGAETPVLVSSSVDVTSGCSIVELFPGYPGYRGYVSGVAGPGEGACIDDLKSKYPRFSQREQDGENQRAARQLGIRSAQDELTWENWMAIGAAREFGDICYACEYANWPQAPVFTEVEVANDDPRILAGLFGEKQVARRFVTENGLAAFETDRLPPDDSLRAIAGVLYSPSVLDAYDLLDAEDEFLSYFTGIKKVNGSYAYFDISKFYHDLVDRGGYVDTPASASAFDQFYTIGEGINSLSYFGIDPQTHQYMLNQAQQLWNDWQMNPHGSSFAEYFRDSGARNWL